MYKCAYPLSHVPAECIGGATDNLEIQRYFSPHYDAQPTALPQPAPASLGLVFQASCNSPRIPR
jgi:hypothetical protein